MNEQQTFERIVAESVSELGPLVPSDDGIERTLSRVDHKRQRPQWLAFLKEPPMRTNSRLAVGSPTVRAAAVLAATFLLVLALAAAGAGAQRLLASDDILVSPDGGGDYTTISEAVAAASDGDTILVRPGVYDESVVIDKDITLRGDGEREDIVILVSAQLPDEAESDSPDSPFAFQIDDATATLDGLTLRGVGSRIVLNGGAPTLQNLYLDGVGEFARDNPGSWWLPGGVDVGAGSTALIEGNDFMSSTLELRDGSSPSISNNRFSDTEISIDGIGTEPTIEGNHISAIGTSSAVWVTGASRPQIRDNVITSEGNGIHVNYGGSTDNYDPRPTIVGNTIEGAAAGIEFIDGAGGEVVGNELSDNGIAISVASLVGDRTVANIRDNVIRGGNLGIATSGPVAPQILGNDIAEAAKVGVKISTSSSPVLADNKLCDNAVNLEVDERANPQIDESNEIC